MSDQPAYALNIQANASVNITPALGDAVLELSSSQVSQVIHEGQSTQAVQSIQANKLNQSIQDVQSAHPGAPAQTLSSAQAIPPVMPAALNQMQPTKHARPAQSVQAAVSAHFAQLTQQTLSGFTQSSQPISLPASAPAAAVESLTSPVTPDAIPVITTLPEAPSLPVHLVKLTAIVRSIQEQVSRLLQEVSPLLKLQVTFDPELQQINLVTHDTNPYVLLLIEQLIKRQPPQLKDLFKVQIVGAKQPSPADLAITSQWQYVLISTPVNSNPITDFGAINQLPRFLQTDLPDLQPTQSEHLLISSDLHANKTSFEKITPANSNQSSASAPAPASCPSLPYSGGLDSGLTPYSAQNSATGATTEPAVAVDLTQSSIIPSPAFASNLKQAFALSADSCADLASVLDLDLGLTLYSAQTPATGATTGAANHKYLGTPELNAKNQQRPHPGFDLTTSVANKSAASTTAATNETTNTTTAATTTFLAGSLLDTVANQNMPWIAHLIAPKAMSDFTKAASTNQENLTFPQPKASRIPAAKSFKVVRLPLSACCKLEQAIAQSNLDLLSGSDLVDLVSSAPAATYTIKTSTPSLPNTWQEPPSSSIETLTWLNALCGAEIDFYLKMSLSVTLGLNSNQPNIPSAHSPALFHSPAPWDEVCYAPNAYNRALLFVSNSTRHQSKGQPETCNYFTPSNHRKARGVVLSLGETAEFLGQVALQLQSSTRGNKATAKSRKLQCRNDIWFLPDLNLPRLTVPCLPLPDLPTPTADEPCLKSANLESTRLAESKNAPDLVELTTPNLTYANVTSTNRGGKTDLSRHHRLAHTENSARKKSQNRQNSAENLSQPVRLERVQTGAGIVGQRQSLLLTPASSDSVSCLFSAIASQKVPNLTLLSFNCNQPYYGNATWEMCVYASCHHNHPHQVSDFDIGDNGYGFIQKTHEADQPAIQTATGACATNNTGLTTYGAAAHVAHHAVAQANTQTATRSASQVVSQAITQSTTHSAHKVANQTVTRVATQAANQDHGRQPAQDATATITTNATWAANTTLAMHWNEATIVGPVTFLFTAKVEPYATLTFCPHKQFKPALGFECKEPDYALTYPYVLAHTRHYDFDAYPDSYVDAYSSVTVPEDIAALVDIHCKLLHRPKSKAYPKSYAALAETSYRTAKPYSKSHSKRYIGSRSKANRLFDPSFELAHLTKLQSIPTSTDTQLLNQAYAQTWHVLTMPYLSIPGRNPLCFTLLPNYLPLSLRLSPVDRAPLCTFWPKARRSGLVKSLKQAMLINSNTHSPNPNTAANSASNFNSGLGTVSGFMSGLASGVGHSLSHDLGHSLDSASSLGSTARLDSASGQGLATGLYTVSGLDLTFGEGLALDLGSNLNAGSNFDLAAKGKGEPRTTKVEGNVGASADRLKSATVRSLGAVGLGSAHGSDIREATGAKDFKRTLIGVSGLGGANSAGTALGVALASASVPVSASASAADQVLVLGNSALKSNSDSTPVSVLGKSAEVGVDSDFVLNSTLDSGFNAGIGASMSLGSGGGLESGFRVGSKADSKVWAKDRAGAVLVKVLKNRKGAKEQLSLIVITPKGIDFKTLQSQLKQTLGAGAALPLLKRTVLWHEAACLNRLGLTSSQLKPWSELASHLRHAGFNFAPSCQSLVRAQLTTNTQQAAPDGLPSSTLPYANWGKSTPHSGATRLANASSNSPGSLTSVNAALETKRAEHLLRDFTWSQALTPYEQNCAGASELASSQGGVASSSGKCDLGISILGSLDDLSRSAGSDCNDSSSKICVSGRLDYAKHGGALGSLVRVKGLGGIGENGGWCGFDSRIGAIGNISSISSGAIDAVNMGGENSTGEIGRATSSSGTANNGWGSVGWLNALRNGHDCFAGTLYDQEEKEVTYKLSLSGVVAGTLAYQIRKPGGMLSTSLRSRIQQAVLDRLHKMPYVQVIGVHLGIHYDYVDALIFKDAAFACYKLGQFFKNKDYWFIEALFKAANSSSLWCSLTKRPM